MKAARNFFNFFSVTILTALISLLSIYILTKKLDIESFAIFGLFSTFISFANGVLTSSLTFIFSKKRFELEEGFIWREVYSTSFFILFFIIVLYLFIILGMIFIFNFDLSPFYIIILFSFLKIFFDWPFNIYLEYFRISGNSKSWSQLSLATLFISTSITFIFLLIEIDKKLILFIGPLFSSFILCVYLITCKINIKYVLYDFSSINFPILKGSILSSSIENFFNFFEKFYLSYKIGLVNFGIYNHSSMYKQYFGLLGNSFANSIWKISLTEAQDAQKLFKITQSTWNFYYLILYLAIVVSIFASKYFLFILTNGVFIDAYRYIPLLLISFYLINSGKEDTAFLYSHNFGKFLNEANSLRVLILIISTIVFVPYFGVYGAILALYISIIFFRIFMHIKVCLNVNIKYNYRWLPLFMFSLTIYTFYFIFGESSIVISILLSLFGLIYGITINLNTITNYLNKKYD
jgi:O-antigen/teichoic acid export membrane protein